MGYGQYFGLCFGDDMTAITVNNHEGTILTAIDAALTGATIAGEAVFASVTVTTSADQARECQDKGATPAAVIRYVGTTEQPAIETDTFGTAEFELRLATRKNRGVDEADAVQEALRLVNAAKNAVHAAPPAVAYPVGIEGEFAYDITWGSPRIDTAGGDSSAPWIVATLPVTFGVQWETKTSH